MYCIIVFVVNVVVSYTFNIGIIQHELVIYDGLNDYKTDYHHGCWTWNKPIVVVCLVVIHVLYYGICHWCFSCLILLLCFVCITSTALLFEWHKINYHHSCWTWNKPIVVVCLVVVHVLYYCICHWCFSCLILLLCFVCITSTALLFEQLQDRLQPQLLNME